MKKTETNKVLDAIGAIRNEMATRDGKPPSYSKLAKTLGVSASTLATWENGSSSPSPKLTARVSEVLSDLRAGNGNGNGNGHNGNGHGHNGNGNGNGHVNRLEKFLVEAGKAKQRVDETFAKCEPASKTTPPKTTDPSRHYAIGMQKKPVAISPEELAVFKDKMNSALRPLGIESLSEPTYVRVDGEIVCSFFAVIRPEGAKRIIASHNHHNRAPSAERVTEYAVDMRGGNWIFTGETLAFTVKGDLVDGGHRIMALLAVGRPFAALVVVGVSMTAFRATGAGKARSLRDRLVVAGRSFFGVRGATIALLNRLENSDEKNDILDDPAVGPSSRLSSTAAFEVEANAIEKYGMNEALMYINGLRWRVGGDLPKHVAVFVFMFMAERSVDAARHFMRLLVEGGAPSGSPILALRDKLALLSKSAFSGNKKVSAPKMERTGTRIRLLVLAWNAWCVGRTNESGNLLNRGNRTAKNLLLSMAAPIQKIESEAREGTTPEIVAATLENARAIAEREEAKKLRDTSGSGGEFVAGVRRRLDLK